MRALVALVVLGAAVVFAAPAAAEVPTLDECREILQQAGGGDALCVELFPLRIDPHECDAILCRIGPFETGLCGLN